MANAFGVDSNDPQAISAAIDADPQAAVKLTELQMQHKERLAEIALDHARIEAERELGTIREVNATMRTEAVSEHWMQWAWRPTWGFVSAAAFLVVCVFVCFLGYEAVTGKDQSAIGMIPLLIGALTTLFGIPGAILGITAWGRNKLKENQAGSPVGAIEALIEKIS